MTIGMQERRWSSGSGAVQERCWSSGVGVTTTSGAGAAMGSDAGATRIERVHCADGEWCTRGSSRAVWDRRWSRVQVERRKEERRKHI